ncbi:MAG: hypothetical protein DLM59_17875 [Pseudonocardiales bacterium]|nr:MAG: hypothetical protein DLM59_17875 [Pseudonocardiales bacterium]
MTVVLQAVGLLVAVLSGVVAVAALVLAVRLLAWPLRVLASLALGVGHPRRPSTNGNEPTR